MRRVWIRFIVRITHPTSIIGVIISGLAAWLYYKKDISDTLAGTLFVISIPLWTSNKPLQQKKIDIKRTLLIEEVIRELIKEFK